MAIGGQKSSRGTTPNAQGEAIACLIHAITAAVNRRTRMACNLRLAAQPDPPLLAAKQQQLAQTDRFLAAEWTPGTSETGANSTGQKTALAQFLLGPIAIE